jgi:YQGE family putative transporter
MLKKIANEFSFFKQQPHNIKILLTTNMLYALVLPVVEIFVGAYVMRNTSAPGMVAYYQLFMYIGIIATSFINGFLLKHVQVKILYAGGILISGISMYVMMLIKSLGFIELGLSGFALGAASGFFWTNRYLLTLKNTVDENRNYFFGIESFFFSIASISVPLLVGVFISQLDGKELFGFLININTAYQWVTIGIILLTIFIVSILWRGRFANPEEKKFIYFRFCRLWNKMLVLSSLKGMVQGFLVTAPAILVLKLVGNEDTLGLIQSISGALTAILVYVLGRIAQPKDRLKILACGVLIFFSGTLFNGILFSASGVILFVLCKVIFQPLYDLAYYPIMMQAIDVVAKTEKRNQYTYILSHELGLFAGRAFGLILFITLAWHVSDVFALKYALIIVALLQLLSVPLAKNITKESNKK